MKNNKGALTFGRNTLSHWTIIIERHAMYLLRAVCGRVTLADDFRITKEYILYAFNSCVVCGHSPRNNDCIDLLNARRYKEAVEHLIGHVRAVDWECVHSFVYTTLLGNGTIKSKAGYSLLLTYQAARLINFAFVFFAVVLYNAM